MDSNEFRRYGHEIVEWIARYFENVEQYPVKSRVRPGEIKNALPELPPSGSESFDLFMKDFDEVIMPGITHWQSPNFFAYFPANSSPRRDAYGRPRGAVHALGDLAGRY